MTNVVIRESVQEDIPTILEFIKEFSEYQKMKMTLRPEQFRADYNHNPPLFACFVVEKSGEPEGLIGFALASFTYATFHGKRLYLETVFIKEEYRNQAVGTKLFSFVCKVAVERGIKVVNFTVLDWSPARKFYEKLGASCVDNLKWHVLYEENIQKASQLF